MTKLLKFWALYWMNIRASSIATLDFLISSIIKVQKGQRLALGLDDEVLENTAPEINIIEGLMENKI